VPTSGRRPWSIPAQHLNGERAFIPTCLSGGEYFFADL